MARLLLSPCYRYPLYSASIPATHYAQAYRHAGLEGVSVSRWRVAGSMTACALNMNSWEGQEGRKVL